jgi:hypothetical protein
MLLTALINACMSSTGERQAERLAVICAEETKKLFRKIVHREDLVQACLEAAGCSAVTYGLTAEVSFLIKQVASAAGLNPELRGFMIYDC